VAQSKEKDTCDEVLWENFSNKVDDESREKLVLKYMPYAEIIAKHIFSKRVYEDIEYSEYVQLAMTGLIESIDRYQPGSMASFKTFSSKRIKGAIYNGLEKLTEKRSQSSYIQRKNRERIKSLASRQTSEDLFSDFAALTVNIAIGFLLDDSGIYRDPENDIVPDNLYDDVVISTLKNNLKNAIAKLPALEKQIIEYHYFQQKSFQEISGAINLSKGRVSQLHKKAIIDIQSLLENIAGFDEAF